MPSVSSRTIGPCVVPGGQARQRSGHPELLIDRGHRQQLRVEPSFGRAHVSSADEFLVSHVRRAQGEDTALREIKLSIYLLGLPEVSLDGTDDDVGIEVCARRQGARDPTREWWTTRVAATPGSRASPTSARPARWESEPRKVPMRLKNPSGHAQPKRSCSPRRPPAANSRSTRTRSRHNRFRLGQPQV